MAKLLLKRETFDFISLCVSIVIFSKGDTFVFTMTLPQSINSLLYVDLTELDANCGLYPRLGSFTASFPQMNLTFLSLINKHGHVSGASSISFLSDSDTRANHPVRLMLIPAPTRSRLAERTIVSGVLGSKAEGSFKLMSQFLKPFLLFYL